MRTSLSPKLSARLEVLLAEARGLVDAAHRDGQDVGARVTQLALVTMLDKIQADLDVARGGAAQLEGARDALARVRDALKILEDATADESDGDVH